MLESKTFRIWFGATLLMCASFCGEVLSAQEKSRSIGPADVEYRISNADVLLISVYQHPELSRTVVVRPDGSITLPWWSAVRVEGLSVSTLHVLLHDKLESMVSNPQVSVRSKFTEGHLRRFAVNRHLLEIYPLLHLAARGESPEFHFVT